MEPLDHDACCLSCRTYIVYHHGLFAQGVRSILEDRRTVQVVGMESDVGKALTAVRSLQPDVVIVEESTGKHQPMRLGAFLNGSTGGRVVTLSLDHEYAMVDERQRIEANDPADLVKAIQGIGKPHIPWPDQPHPNASMLFTPETGPDDDEGRSGKKSPVLRALKEERKKPETIPRASRGKRKGGCGGNRSAQRSSLVAEPKNKEGYK